MKNKASSNKSDSILIKKFPVKQQLNGDDCSVCVLWCVLHYYKLHLSYRELYKIVNPPTDPYIGVTGEQIKKLLKKYKVKHIDEKSSIRKLKKYTNNNCPIIVSIQARKEYNKEWRKTRKYGHYAVVLKIIKNKVLFMDPGIGKIRSLSVQDFKERWHDADEKTFYRNCAITCLSKN